MVELSGDEFPALVFAAHEIFGGNTYVVEEDCVDVVGGEQVERVDADSRRVFHVHDHDRQPGVLRRFGVGAHGEPTVVRIAGQARPELLPVDHPLVAVALGASRQRGEISACLGFAVADAEVEVALQYLGQEEVLLGVGAMGHDLGPDGVDRQHRHRRSGAHRLVEEDELLDVRAPLAAVLLGPADAEPAVRAHAAHHFAHALAHLVRARELRADLRGQQPVVVGPQLAAQGLLFFVVADVHGGGSGGMWAGTRIRMSAFRNALSLSRRSRTSRSPGAGAGRA